MNIIYWIIFGSIVGWIASVLTHNNRRMGLVLNIVVGLIGSVIGGWIASGIVGGGITVFTWQGFVFSIVGAVILLVIVNLIKRARF
ncbi:MAG TPA: GlsB/YeaQ/YmgE family stress response membrane protein [Firmicutes bacterium]|jgi:uncharacterized membrane protein YeaQ/YmgE (transglycosylase-associated protein family)|nr:GlsB/YeaQ/YmgE family stress response membrane protein [Bacillota bacterium]HAV19482.1 GlsB/YeaQ/YmgE family stress response membrane protein [Bacillota bacterium]